MFVTLAKIVFSGLYSTMYKHSQIQIALLSQSKCASMSWLVALIKQLFCSSHEAAVTDRADGTCSSFVQKGNIHTWRLTNARCSLS
jgi:hypothetical protein